LENPVIKLPNAESVPTVGEFCEFAEFDPEASATLSALAKKKPPEAWGASDGFD